MKKFISTIDEALILELENLYCSEKKLGSGLDKLGQSIHSEKLQGFLTRYVDCSGNKRLKIDRIFSYLNHEPKACHTNVINEMIDETQSRIAFAQDRRFQDLLLIACLQRINKYLMGAYQTSLRYAEELELETPVELLEMMIRWETKFEKELVMITNDEINKPLDNGAELNKA